MNNDNFMVFVYNAIIALFAFFVAAPMLLNAISLFTVQKRFAKVMVDEGVVKEETVRRLHPKKQVAGVLISLLVLAGLGSFLVRVQAGHHGKQIAHRLRQVTDEVVDIELIEPLRTETCRWAQLAQTLNRITSTDIS